MSADLTRKTTVDEEYSKEDWAVVLESWNSGTIPGNSQLGLLVLPIPQKVAGGS